MPNKKQYIGHNFLVLESYSNSLFKSAETFFTCFSSRLIIGTNHCIMIQASALVHAKS